MSSWPMSVLRLTSDSKEDLINLADKILQEGASIPESCSADFGRNRRDTASHHTPIARKRDGQFELDLVLRDNRLQ